MEILIDSLDLNTIRHFSQIGILSGVTTNPTFSKRYGMHDDLEMVHLVRDALNKGKIHVEAFGIKRDEIIKNANVLSEKTGDNDLVFKIPFSEEGVAASSELEKNGYVTNLHLVFSVNQALISSRVNASYICPLVGRLDDIGHDALDNVKDMVYCLKESGSRTKVMVSSVRHPLHVIESFKTGAHAITIPPNVLHSMFYHPLSEKGLITFKQDLESIQPITRSKINSSVVVKKSAKLIEALTILTMNNSSAVIIADNERLLGIFTVGDLKRLNQKNIMNVNDLVYDHCTTNPIVIDITENVSEARELMKNKNIEQLVVMDDEKVVGLLEQKELL